MNYYDLLKGTIKEYFINKDDETSRKKIISLFYLFNDDIDKSLALQLIINNLKDTSLFIVLFKDILKYRKIFNEEDKFFDALSKTDAVPCLLNKYKKYIKLFDKEKLSLKELEDLDLLMYYLDILKSLALNDNLRAPMKKDKPYVKTKIVKRLKNLDLKFNKLLEKINIEDIDDYQGILFHIRQIKSDTDFTFSTNDKKFIKYYLETTNFNKEQLYKNSIITYIMSSSKSILFIKEMQELIKSKYQNYFEEIRLEQLSLINKVNQFELSSINRYCYNAILTDEVININLANILIRKHLLCETTLTKATLTNCLKSIMAEYTETFNISKTALIIYKKEELGKVNGYNNDIDKTIGINESLLDDFVQLSKVNVLNTIFHELTHAYQANRIGNYNDYLIRKEMLISNYHKCFYHKNYYRIYYEIDARSNGTVETLRYLKQIAPEVANEYEVLYIKQTEIENANLKMAKIKKSPYKKNYGIDSVDNIFEELVKKHPQIIRRNEFFKLEFNIDGSKKSLKEMLENYPNLKQNEKFILKEVLKSRSLIMSHKEILMEIEESIEIDNEISWYYVELLVNRYYLKLDETLLADFIYRHYNDLKYQNIVIMFKEALEKRKNQIPNQGLENTPKTR